MFSYSVTLPLNGNTITDSLQSSLASSKDQQENPNETDEMMSFTGCMPSVTSETPH